MTTGTLCLEETFEGFYFVETLLDRENTGPRYIVGDVISKSNLTVIGASFKSFKTWLSQDLALAVASGQPWLGMPTVKGAVLYIDGENDINIVIAERSKKLWQGRGVERGTTAPLGFQKLLPSMGMDTRAGIERIEMLCEALKPSLVIIDPLIRMVGTSDENSATQMRQMVDNLKAIASKYDCAVVINHHVRKGQQGYAARLTAEDLRGSSDIPASMDTILAIQHYNGNYELELLETRNKTQFTAVGFAVTDTAEDATVIRVAERKVKVSAEDKAKAKILDYLRDGEKATGAIQEALGLGDGTWRRAVESLVADGLVVKPSHGRWALAE